MINGPLRAVAVVNLYGERKLAEILLNFCQCRRCFFCNNAFAGIITINLFSNKIVRAKISDIELDVRDYVFNIDKTLRHLFGSRNADKLRSTKGEKKKKTDYNFCFH
jgi:hypothetical protein